MKKSISKLNFSKQNGLIPAIIQNYETLEVLMLGFMNKEALKKTITDKKVTFFSRTKNQIWQKGETSGNYLKVIDIKTDCDSDSLLILAKPTGPTCHTGNTSCFKNKSFNLLKLFKLLYERKKSAPSPSYTEFLYKSGLKKILAKIKEESTEVVKAAIHESKQRLIEESCDLIYHLFVLLNHENITMKNIDKELRKRNKM